MDFKRNLLYTGLAAASGTAGYFIGRSKSFRGVSLTLMAISMMLYLPRGCELVNNYMDAKMEMEKTKILIESRKDSINDMVYVERIRKDSIIGYYNSMIKKDHAQMQKMLYEVRSSRNQIRELEKVIEEHTKNFEECADQYYVKDPGN